MYRIKPPDPLAKPSGHKARKEAKLGKILDQMYNDLQIKKQQSKFTIMITVYVQSIADDSDKPLRLLVKVEKPIPRPPTPTIEPPNEVSIHKCDIIDNFYVLGARETRVSYNIATKSHQRSCYTKQSNT